MTGREKLRSRGIERVNVGSHEELCRKNGKYYMRVTNPRNGTVRVYTEKTLENGKLGFGMNNREGIWTRDELEILFM